jgi:polyphosphate kinase
MIRNLDRRVESLVKVADPVHTAGWQVIARHG